MMHKNKIPKSKACISDHFDGEKFYNPYTSMRGLSDLLYWLWTRHPTPWPKEIAVKMQKVKDERVFNPHLRVTHINHSTVLIQFEGYNFLTDPIWSKRASPFSWIGPKRVISPGVLFDDLPPIDFVIISHNHYDHMDLPTLTRLNQTHQPHFFVPQGNKSYLEAQGLQRITELDWWSAIPLSSTCHLTFVPGQHFSARGLWDRNKTLWGGYMLQGHDKSVYFAGDTGYSPYFKQIRERLGAPTLSLLPIGAFEPKWFMSPMHMSPQDAVQAFEDLGSKYAMSIHFGTFPLTDEGITVPIIMLEKALQAHSLSLEQFWILQPGEGREI